MLSFWLKLAISPLFFTDDLVFFLEGINAICLDIALFLNVPNFIHPSDPGNSAFV